MATTHATGLRSAVRAAAAQTRRVPVVQPDPTSRTKAAVARNSLIENGRTTVQLERRKGTIESGGASSAETSGMIDVKAPAPTAAGTSPHLRRVRATEPPQPQPQRARRRARITWLGVVVSPPELGASLMIGTWLRPEFRVTSPIVRIVQRKDGVVVQTESETLYFAKHAGDTYLVQPTA
jgi:hypothetical protein